MLAAPDHDTNNEADFQDSYTNLIIGAQTNHHINHSPAVKYYNANRLKPIVVTPLTMSVTGQTLSSNDQHKSGPRW